MSDEHMENMERARHIGETLERLYDELTFEGEEEEAEEEEEMEEEEDRQNFYEYLEDCLDIKVICGLDKTYYGAIICFCTGGPHIELDTRDGRVTCYGWFGSNEAYYRLNNDVLIAIDEHIERLFNLQ